MDDLQDLVDLAPRYSLSESDSVHIEVNQEGVISFTVIELPNGAEILIGFSNGHIIGYIAKEGE